MKKPIRIFFSVSIMLLSILGCAPRAPKLVEIVRTTDMISTFVTQTLVGTNEQELQEQADTTFAFMRGLSSKFNIYDPRSEVSRLNAGIAGNPVNLSSELAEVLHRAASAHKMTDGYFDITVRPLVLLWKEAKKKDKIPSMETIEKVKSDVGFTNLSFSDSKVTIKKKGVSVDLGGIAKAYILQKTVDRLKHLGIRAGIVNIGGDLYAWGKRPNGKKWRVGIQHPREENSLLKILRLEDRALLTSGDYERFFMIDGKRFSHIIDPFTGLPDSDIISVTVVTPDIMAADGLSAGLSAMGSKKALRKIGQLKKEVPGTEYLLVWIENGKIRHFSTFR